MRFRFPSRWEGRDHGPNPLTEAVTARRAAGLPLLDLTISNPTTVGLAFPEDWPGLLTGQDGGSLGGKAVGAGRAAVEAIRGYDPDPRGLAAARRALEAYYRARGALAPGADDFFLTAGTSEAYSHLFKLLCEPGDAILAPRPSYPLLDTLADLAGLRLDSYPLVARRELPTADALPAATGWALDRDALVAALTPRTRLIVVVTPNNPTGSVWSQEDAAWLVTLAQARGLALVVDEVFADYRHDGKTTPLVHSDGPLVFTLNGLSKLVGLPQLKLAWIHVAGNAPDKAVACETLEWMCDAALSVSTASQIACAGLLRRRHEFQTPIHERIAVNRATLHTAEVATPRLEVLWPEGGWCVPVRCTGIVDDEAFAIQLMDEAGVLVQPGYFFDFEDEEIIVLSLLTPPEVFRTGVEHIANALRKII